MPYNASAWTSLNKIVRNQGKFERTMSKVGVYVTVAADASLLQLNSFDSRVNARLLHHYNSLTRVEQTRLHPPSHLSNFYSIVVDKTNWSQHFSRICNRICRNAACCWHIFQHE